MPLLLIDRSQIETNLRIVQSLCTSCNVGLTVVTKGLASHASFIKLVMASGVERIAVARSTDVVTVREAGFAGEVLHLRPLSSEARFLVGMAQRFQVCGFAAARAFAAAATSVGVRIGIDMIVEAGDRREGIRSRDGKSLLNRISCLPNIDSIGLSINIGCTTQPVDLGSSTAVLERLLTDIGDSGIVRVSVGGSAFLPLLQRGKMPSFVTEIRVGEPLILGTIAPYGEVVPHMSCRSAKLRTEVIQVERTPDGLSDRVVVALGRQDVIAEGIIEAPGTRILYMTSDHMVIERDPSRLNPGDVIDFDLRYTGVSTAAASRYTALVLE